MRSSRPAAVSVAALLGACAFASVAQASTPGARLGPPYEAGGMWFVPAADPAYDEQGVAEVYGAGQDGRVTVSGERFDPRALTAAHATLPLPGVVEVTNLDNGRTVRLRINDRGPYRPGRILGLTAASAKALGAPEGGPIHVRVRYPDAGGRVTADRAAGRPVAAVRGFDVQVGAFGQKARAEQVAARAASAGHARVASVDHAGTTLYRVLVGPVGDAGAAETARDSLSSLGFDDAKVVPAL